VSKKVRGARFNRSFLLWGVLLVCSMFMSLRSMFNRMRQSCMRVWMLVWTVALIACTRIVARTVILAQVSLSRLGESLRNSPRVLLEQLVQAEGSGLERRVVSLRREWLAQASSRGKSGLLCSQPRLGEVLHCWAKGDLAQASWSCPSEMLADCHCSRPRLGEKA